MAQVLGPGAGEAIDDAAVAWTKAFGRRPLVDGRSFRELYAWKGVSLWWFAELFLHHSTQAAHYVRVIEVAHRLLDGERPDELEAHGLPADEALLVERSCTARGDRRSQRAAAIDALKATDGINRQLETYAARHPDVQALVPD